MVNELPLNLEKGSLLKNSANNGEFPCFPRLYDSIYFFKKAKYLIFLGWQRNNEFYKILFPNGEIGFVKKQHSRFCVHEIFCK